LFDKTGDPLSKVTDDVNYTITLQNTSSPDTPNMVCTITDPMLGIDDTNTLASGQTYTMNPVYTVLEGDPDPLVNAAAVTCSPIGFDNVYEADDDHSTELFQPEVEVIKTGPETAFVGDVIQYSFTIINQSSPDAPPLILDAVNDDKLGDLTPTANSNGCGSLVSGGTCNFTVDWTVPGGLENPHVNVVTVHYHPDGFTNDISDDDPHSLTWYYDLQTAWAVNGLGEDFIGTIAYPGANWATYFAYPPTPAIGPISLYQSQTNEAGLLTFTEGVTCDVGPGPEDCVQIRIELFDGYVFAFGDGQTDVHVDGYSDTPTVSNPSPGQMPWSFEADSEDTAVFAVPLRDFIFYGVHALVAGSGGGD
jgi:hypothetical protein